MSWRRGLIGALLIRFNKLRISWSSRTSLLIPTHSLQMKSGGGPAISASTSCCVLPQHEQETALLSTGSCWPEAEIAAMRADVLAPRDLGLAAHEPITLASSKLIEMIEIARWCKTQGALLLLETAPSLRLVQFSAIPPAPS